MRGCSRLTLVLSRRAVTGAAWAEVAKTVARVAVVRAVERVAVGERAVVVRAVVARAAAAVEAVGAFARAPPDGPRAPAASLNRLSSLRSQVQLGLYIVRGDNMCAPAPAAAATEPTATAATALTATLPASAATATKHTATLASAL